MIKQTHRTRIRALAAFLSTVSLLPAMTGCSLIEIHMGEASTDTETACVTEAETTPKPETEPPEETTAEDEDAPVIDLSSVEEKEEKARTYLKEVRKGNFEGMSLLIASAGVSTSELATAGVYETLDVIREERLRWVEDRYNTRILTFSYDADALYQEVYKAHLSSDSQYVADFYEIPPKDLGKYQKNGLLMNMRSLPFTDYTRPYYNRKAVQQMSAGYGVWGVAGSFTEKPELYYGVYFNKTLASSLGLESPYQQVENGTWTWESFFAGAKAAAASADDVYGDNMQLYALDRAERLIYGSSGLHPATCGKDVTPALNVAPERMQEMANVLYDCIYKGTTSPQKDTDVNALFDRGKLLYLVSDLSAVPARADIRVDWGVVPLPKAYTGQKNYFAGTGDLSILCAPAVTGAPERSGILLQALFAASYGAYADVFVRDALLYSVRDERTVDMLELIFGSASYDFSAMFASGYSALSASTVGGLHQTVTSIYSFDRILHNNQTAAANEMKNAFPVE